MMWNGTFSNCLYCTLCTNFTKWFETIQTAVCLEILAGLQQRAQQSLIYAAALSSNTCTLSVQPKRSANVHKKHLSCKTLCLSEAIYYAP